MQLAKNSDRFQSLRVFNFSKGDVEYSAVNQLHDPGLRLFGRRPRCSICSRGVMPFLMKEGG